MDINRLVEQLEEKLKSGLPGAAAHRLMAPMTTDQRRFNIEERPNARQGAVMVLLYPEKDEVYFPLIKRPRYQGVHSGQIALPGGGKEERDKSLIETALRETEEEIGVGVEEINVIGTLTHLYIPASNYKVLPVVGFCIDKPAFKADQREVDEIIPSNLQNLISSRVGEMVDIVISEKYQLKAPHYKSSDHIIWGATAMMLSELQTILKTLD